MSVYYEYSIINVCILKLEKLCILYNEVVFFLPDELKDSFEISFCAIGDAYTDQYPIQVTDFAKGSELDENIKAIDTKQETHQEFQNSLEKLFNSDIVWSRNNCVSWYQNEKGQLPTLWPGYTFAYWWITRKVNWEHHIITK